MKPKIIIVCGPTATGKTALAVNLAKRLSSEVISADSMCIYKGFDIGTAKPTRAERQEVKHHMIDIRCGNEPFSVADYKQIATPIAESLLHEGKTPILCGGTGFYIESVLYDFSYGNGGKNDAVRKKYEQLAATEGKDALYLLLQEKDPLTAEKLHKNDVHRVIRALEICECSGKTKSQFADRRIPKYDYIAVCFDFQREELYKRIDLRAQKMFDEGLVEEVEHLKSAGICEGSQAMQGIGYKEVLAYLRGEFGLKEAIELVKQNSRRYAKRQITFFKRLENIRYLQPKSSDEAAEEVLKLL